jgi:hypothetical protein
MAALQFDLEGFQVGELNAAEGIANERRETFAERFRQNAQIPT